MKVPLCPSGESKEPPGCVKMEIGKLPSPLSDEKRANLGNGVQ